MQSALQSEVHQSPLWMWQKFTDQGPLQKVLLPNTAIDLQIPILRRLVSISSSIGWVFCISLKWSNIQRNWECSQKRSLKASIERTVSVNNESGVSKGIQRNGIFLQKLIVLVIDPLNNLFEQWESFKLEHKWMIMHPHTYIHSKCQLQ